MNSKTTINWILQTINDALHQGSKQLEVSTSLPDSIAIDPEKFNRMTTTIEGETFAISVFKPATVPFAAVEPVDSPPLELTEKVSAGERSFSDDHRHNPALHKLYTAWALHDLEILQRFLGEMNDCSRWPMSRLSHILQEEMGKEVLSNAAWFEAAALLFAKADLSEYEALTSESEMAEVVGDIQKG